MTPLRLFASTLLVAALAAAPAAQTTALLIDDFEDGDLSEYNLFAGGEAPTLATTDDATQGAFALEATFDGDDYGDFAGFFRAVPGAPADISDIDEAYLSFDLASEGTFTLEINFQDGDGETGGEIRDALQLAGSTGYRQVALPLRGFFNSREGLTFDPTDLGNLVFTVIDVTGDGDSGTAETTLRIDEIRIVQDVTLANDLTFDDFEDGDFSEYFVFSGGADPELSTTTDTPSGMGTAIRAEIDADGYGGFAGFGKTIEDAPIDVSGTDALNFMMRANGAGVLEVNVQSGAATPNDGPQFEGRQSIALTDTDGEFVPVSIPLDALIQTRAERPDLSDVYNVVFTVVQLQTGDGFPSNDFSLTIDDLGFGTIFTGATAVDDVPETFAVAPTAFPNPTAGAATVAFELATATDVRAEVYDLIGRRVATLAGGPTAAGPVRLAVPTATLSPGTYLVRVRTDAGAATTRLTVVR